MTRLGRRLGFAEFGDPQGKLVLWFHGTPGRRRQFPLLGRRAAEQLGLRVVTVGRPGTCSRSRTTPSGPCHDHSGGRRRVLQDPEMEGMFIDDIVLVAKGGFQAIVDDARLFGRDWGFRLGDVKAPVRWWHGDADNIVPLPDAQAAVDIPPDAELILRTEESYLGGFATADEVPVFIRSHL